jgi:hypothetical protein
LFGGIIYFSYHQKELRLKISTDGKKTPVLFVSRKKYQKNSKQPSHISSQKKSLSRKSVTRAAQKVAPKKVRSAPVTKPSPQTHRFASVYPRSALPPKKIIKPEKKEKKVAQHVLPELLPAEPEHVEQSQEDIIQHDHDIPVVERDEYVELYQDIYNNWQIPRGFSPELSCTYRVMVTTEGKVADVVLQKSSGVLVYDTACQAALFKTTYPKSIWGKEFTISFDKEVL